MKRKTLGSGKEEGGWEVPRGIRNRGARYEIPRAQLRGLVRRKYRDRHGKLGVTVHTVAFRELQKDILILVTIHQAIGQSGDSIFGYCQSTAS